MSTPKIIICPSDAGKVEATNWTISFTNNASKAPFSSLSYSVGTDAQETFPQSFLSSDRNMTNDTRNAAKMNVNEVREMGADRDAAARTLANKAGWDNEVHQNQGNACMGDGSVQQLSSARLREQLRNSGTTSNTFVFPAKKQ